MKKNLLMEQDSLDEIVGRLICFNALLETIRLAMDDDDKLVDTMSSAHDLLDCICRDFQADIDSAEFYAGKGVTA